MVRLCVWRLSFAATGLCKEMAAVRSRAVVKIEPDGREFMECLRKKRFVVRNTQGTTVAGVGRLEFLSRASMISVGLARPGPSAELFFHGWRARHSPRILSRVSLL